MIMPTETITRKRFTVDEYHRMSDIGIFPKDKRFELIRGEILEMPTAKPPHSGRVNRLTHLFTSRLGEFVIVSVQNPSSIDDYSEPAPDVSLLKPRGDFYTSGPSDARRRPPGHRDFRHDASIRHEDQSSALCRSRNSRVLDSQHSSKYPGSSHGTRQWPLHKARGAQARQNDCASWVSSGFLLGG